MISEKKWAVRWYEDVSLRSLCDFTVQMRKVGLDWPGTFQQSLSLHNEKDCSHPIPKLTPYSVCCTSGYTFQFCILKIFYCSCIIKNYLLGISLTQSWKKSFFCSDTWQMFLVLNGMGIKDKRPNCPSVSHFIIQLYPVLFTQFRPSHKRAWGSPLVTCRWDTRPESLSMNNTDPLND